MILHSKTDFEQIFNIKHKHVFNIYKNIILIFLTYNSAFKNFKFKVKQ